jgi:hypothetical protein
LLLPDDFEDPLLGRDTDPLLLDDPLLRDELLGLDTELPLRDDPLDLLELPEERGLE